MLAQPARSAGAHTLPACIAPAVLLMAAFALRARGVLDDPFHHGEYFASALNLLAQGSPLPLPIHGALDFLPALAAHALWGEAHYLFPTWALYKLLNLLAALALVLAGAEVGRQAQAARWPQRGWMLAPLAVAAPFVAGYRDLFLLLALWAFLRAARDAGGPALLPKLLFGALLACSLHWSYDRGLAGLLALGVATAVLASRDRGWLAAALAFAVVAAAAGFVHPVFSIAHWFGSVQALARTSAQWSHGWQPQAVVNTAFAVLVNGLAVAASLLRRPRPAFASPAFARSLALALLCLLMLRAGTNRADTQHMLMTLWVPLLVLLQLHGLSLPAAPMRALAATLLAATLLVAGKAAGKGEFGWFAQLAAVPDNRAVAPQGSLRTADRLRQAGAACAFNLANDGLVNALAGLPTCSRFAYPVYAGRQYEAELVNAVKSRLPAAIVYSSEHWPYRIDGRSMRERMPALDAVLRELYPREECEQSYCIRYQHP